MSMRSAIESLLRDKASIGVLALGILFFFGDDVESLYKIIRFALLVFLVAFIIYQGYKHEEVKLSQEGKDLESQTINWFTKLGEVLSNIGVGQTVREIKEESGITTSSAAAVA